MPGPDGFSRMLVPLLLIVMGLAGAAPASAATNVFGYTGAEKVFQVPANVHSVHVLAVGAKGGTAEGQAPGVGGFGAAISADLAVNPGQLLYVEVGGNGADGTNCCSMSFNGGGGGGLSGTEMQDGGAGGGGTDVRTLSAANPGSTGSRQLVAGGGGGGGAGDLAVCPGGNQTGSNGGAAGQPGATMGYGQGGGAGTATKGGDGGPSTYGTPPGGGTAGSGGRGGGTAASAPAQGGGGGGGGYYGGGGGAGAAGGCSNGGGGGGGGSSFSATGTTAVADTSGVPSVTITYPDPAGAGGGATPARAAASKAKISPGAFPAAPSGPSALTAKRKRRYGAIVSYTLNQAASVRFTVERPGRGRRGSRGRCVKPTKKNRKARRCTRYVAVRGSFTRAGKAGSNKFRFTGRLRAKKLRPGRYRLVVTPTAAGRKGTPARVSFRIVR